MIPCGSAGGKKCYRKAVGDWSSSSLNPSSSLFLLLDSLMHTYMHACMVRILSTSSSAYHQRFHCLHHVLGRTYVKHSLYYRQSFVESSKHSTYTTRSAGADFLNVQPLTHYNAPGFWSGSISSISNLDVALKPYATMGLP